MKRTILLTSALLALSACATQPVPITDYNAAYTGKWEPLAPVASPRPEPRPERTKRVWLACPEALWHDDCDSGEINASSNRVADDIRPDAPVLDDSPDRPVGPDRPVPDSPDSDGDRPVGPGPDTPPPVEPETPDEPTPPGNPGHPGNGGGKPAGQNPGNNKPVGNAPFDGERGEQPSGRNKDKGRGPA